MLCPQSICNDGHCWRMLGFPERRALASHIFKWSWSSFSSSICWWCGERNDLILRGPDPVFNSIGCLISLLRGIFIGGSWNTFSCSWTSPCTYGDSLWFLFVDNISNWWHCTIEGGAPFRIIFVIWDDDLMWFIGAWNPYNLCFCPFHLKLINCFWWLAE